MIPLSRLLVFSFSISLATAALSAAAPESYEVVVYGGTSGGVTAAVQAAREGRRVVLISPVRHLGGLTISGLGWTDLGAPGILGGLSKEFYQRVFRHYEAPAAWDRQTRRSYGNRGQGGPAFDPASQVASVFEPKVAEAVFAAMLEEAHVPVVTGRLDLTAGVRMADRKIVSLKLEDGREFGGRFFIDASYEGDLLPGAGVTFTIGREANATYGETLNGVQTARATKNQLPGGIDPYLVKGDSASGLLPGVEPAATGPDGTADRRLQAYCYRMVLTDVPANRIEIARPPGYREEDYELLFRAIEAGQTGGFFKLDPMPNRKTDSNNEGGISTDWIGGNYGPGWDWTTLDHAGREALARRHRLWQLGLVWTLQHHPRVPAAVRTAYARWGLPADEFADNDHWPYDLYVRESRRMVGALVMTERHCSGLTTVPDSVALAAYSMDSHHVVRRVRDGVVKNEGDVQSPVRRPFPISYRALVPKPGECRNLLVPWSLSASHMAFGSIRMEPVFMALGQSSAIAAGLALERDADVQVLAYEDLRPRLLAAGQALGQAERAGPPVVIDNADAASVVVSGAWTAASATPGYIGRDYLHDGGEGRGSKQVFYRIPPDLKGGRQVLLRWTSRPNRASRVEVEIRHQGGVAKLTVDQRQGGGEWHPLGVFSFGAGAGADEGVTILNRGADGYVIADAVGFAPVSTPER